MKFRHLAALLATACAAPLVHAQATATVSVTAKIADACAFDTPSALVDLGLLRPDSTEARSASTGLRYRCTKGMSHKLQVNQDSSGQAPGALSAAGQPDLPVSVKWSPGTRQGRGFSDTKVLDLDLEVSIQPEQFRDAAAGDYRGDLVVTITP